MEALARPRVPANRPDRREDIARGFLWSDGSGRGRGRLCRLRAGDRALDAGAEVRVLDQLIYDNGFALAHLFDDPRCGSSAATCATDDLAEAAEGATDVVLLASLVGDPICKAYPSSPGTSTRTARSALSTSRRARDRAVRLHFHVQQLRNPRSSRLATEEASSTRSRSTPARRSRWSSTCSTGR